jgi:hypothetical protein
MAMRWAKIVTGFGVLVLLVVAAAGLADEPLRSYVERKMNRSLKGYTVRIGGLHVHPIGVSLTLENMRLSPSDRLDAPLAQIPRWTASLHWKALVSGRLVNDQYIEHPTFHVTHALAKQETQDEVPVKDRGWQDAVESIYPFKINQVTITDAALTYVDEAEPERPLRFHNVNVYATNIRNVESADQTYPSALRFEGSLFGSGNIHAEGHADFLAEPHVAVKAAVVVDGAPLAPFLPVTGQYNIQLTSGTMSAEGSVEYGPAVKVVDLQRLTIDDLRVDYVHSEQTRTTETARAKAAVDTAKHINDNQETLVRIERISVVNGEFGFVNQAAKPDYRVFLSHANVALEHYSSQLQEGAASMAIRGKFMGSGATEIIGVWHPEHESPDFEIKVQMTGTHIRSLNDVLRAHGNLDVAAGMFSCYSEFKFHNGRLRGYVKPLVRKLDVYDSKQDRGKNALEKVREGAIEDLSSLLKNIPRQEVATKADVSGSPSHPRTETVQIVIGLIQNAFFEAILPGFEKEFGSTRARVKTG